MNASNISLTHIVRKPFIESIGKPPIIILLHGWGSNETDLMALADYIDGRYFVASLRAPIVMAPGAFGWFLLTGEPGRLGHNDAQAQSALQLVLSVIDELTTEYDVDAERVF